MYSLKSRMPTTTVAMPEGRSQDLGATPWIQRFDGNCVIYLLVVRLHSQRCFFFMLSKQKLSKMSLLSRIM
jgi:hypothetical protein